MDSRTPGCLRPRPEAARARGQSRHLIEFDETAGVRSSRVLEKMAGRPQRRIEGYRRGQALEGRGAGCSADGQGRRSQVRDRHARRRSDTVEEKLNKALAEIPNAPADDVPDGADAAGNVEHHVIGNKRNYAFKPKQHFELGEALGQMDFELAAKLSGARFVVLQKGLARLERALGQCFLDTHTSDAARLHRSRSAADRARRCHVRHRATAEVRTATIFHAVHRRGAKPAAYDG